jgi:hypothetical protein
MKNKYSPFLIMLISLLAFSSISTTSLAQKKNNTKSSVQITGDNGVILKVDVEYAVNKKNILTNDRYVEYTITNVGPVTYNGKIDGNKNALVFDLTTKDGKVIEKTVSFLEMLSPGKSTVIKYFVAEVGPKALCIAVKPSRLDFWLTN